MTNINEVLMKVSFSILILFWTIVILCTIASAFSRRNDIYELWNTLDEFEEVSSLRKFLLDKNWVHDKVRLDDLDYILVLVRQCSDFFPDVPTPLVLSMISVESNFNKDLVGFNNDTGLMQIIPKFHRERIEKYIYNENVDLFDPRLNVMVGMDYLDELLSWANGDLEMAIMAYNMGPDRAKDSGNDGYATVYCRTVLKRMDAIQIFLEGR